MKETIRNEVAQALSELMPTIANKFIRPSEQEIKNYLSPMQLRTLFFLSCKDIMTMSELSSKLNISKQQMTPIIEKLVTCHLVTRENDMSDRRILKIKLTPEGLKLLENFQKEIFDMMKLKIECLSEEDLNTLYTALKDLYKIIHKIP